MARQQIPWLRIGAEGTAIVVSILLAFAIDAAWERRGEVDEERQILIGLEVEFTDLSERLAFWAGFGRRGADLIERYLSGGAADMTRLELEEVFTLVMLVNVLDQGGALDALLASGRLERIGDHDIRARLSKWPDWLEDIHTNDRSARSFAWGQILPYLATKGFPRNVCPQGEYWCAPDDSVPDDYIALAGDTELRAMLIFRRITMWAAARDHEAALAEAEELLGLIDARLDVLGRE